MPVGANARHNFESLTKCGRKSTEKRKEKKWREKKSRQESFSPLFHLAVFTSVRVFFSFDFVAHRFMPATRALSQSKFTRAYFNWMIKINRDRCVRRCTALVFYDTQIEQHRWEFVWLRRSNGKSFDKFRLSDVRHRAVDSNFFLIENLWLASLRRSPSADGRGARRDNFRGEIDRGHFLSKSLTSECHFVHKFSSIFFWENISFYAFASVSMPHWKHCNWTPRMCLLVDQGRLKTVLPTGSVAEWASLCWVDMIRIMSTDKHRRLAPVDVAHLELAALKSRWIWMNGFLFSFCYLLQ